MTQTVAEALLSPTRTYAPIIRAVQRRLGQDLHAAIHCSGGGLSKIIRFGERKHYIKDHLFPTPPLFIEIQRSASVPWKEMYSVFNMGHRMELICPQNRLPEVTEISQSFGIEAKRIGSVQDADAENAVTVESAHGKFEY